MQQEIVICLPQPPSGSAAMAIRFASDPWVGRCHNWNRFAGLPCMPYTGFQKKLVPRELYQNEAAHSSFLR